MAWYESHAEIYADMTSRSAPDGDLAAFMEALPRSRAPVLDWGAGPGNTAALLLERQIAVTATDASPAMARIAAGLGIRMRVEPFEALPPDPVYRGIWSNFGLVHAPFEMLPDLTALAARALLPGGVLHLGLTTLRDDLPEAGEGSHRDGWGIVSTHVAPDRAARLAEAAGLSLVSTRQGHFRLMLTGARMDFVIVLARKP